MKIVVVGAGYPLKNPMHGMFAFDQAKALYQSGHKVKFFAIDLTSIRHWRKWGFSEKLERGIQIHEFNFPMGPIFPNIGVKIASAGFRRILRKVICQDGKPDIVHVHFSDLAMCVVKACKNENIPYVVTEHASWVNRDDLTENEIAPLRYVYQNAAAVIAVSSVLARRIQRYTGVQATVIPNIIDLSVFQCERKEHEGFRFVSAGNLNYGKGFDVLLKAFSVCLKNGLNAELLIMGDGSEKENLQSLIKELNMEKQVKLFGRYVRPQFSEILSESDAFVLASRGETFGVVYAEAMACGVPVIATRCGGPEDFVEESNGMLVDVDDVEGLASAMMKLYGNASHYDAKQIADRAKERFSAKCVATEITRLILNYIR